MIKLNKENEMNVNEKDLSGNEKRAANCTLTYDHNGVYTDCGKPELWECYLERCKA